MAWRIERWSGHRGLEHGFGGRNDPTPDGVRTLHQVHGNVVVDGAAAEPGTEGDALITQAGGPAVGVWTADCVPVLLVAPVARVAAAVHSGWRGTAAGVVDAALERMASLGVEAASVEAAIGPAIGACCYEVGEEVREALRQRYGAETGPAFTERAGSLRLDLREFLLRRLRTLGVSRVETVGPCTGCSTDRLYSYRIEGKTGRQLSWIGWRSELHTSELP